MNIRGIDDQPKSHLLFLKKLFPLSEVYRQVLYLFGGMLVCGIISILLGKELDYDLAHYHFYNPYAFLHHRTDFDFWPSSFVHQFINPTIDFFTYFLITNCTPLMTGFILGAIHGINFWLLLIIANLFLPHRIAFIIALLGMYSPSVLSGIGSFRNDNLISIFILLSVAFYLKGLLSQQTLYTNQIKMNALIHQYFMVAGFLLGIAIGLKLTAVIFIPGVLFATLTIPTSPHGRIKLLGLTLLTMFAGILIFSGYWMYWMWIKYHNPLFPFFNNIFNASNNSWINWRDTRFLPQGIWQHIFFPFYFSWDGRTSDGGFCDFRFAMVYFLLILVILFYIKNKWVFIFNSPKQPRNNTAVYQVSRLVLYKWLLTFFIFSYLIWQFYFSIARYITALEMLAPLLIYLLICRIPVSSFIHNLIIVIFFYTLFFFMSPTPITRIHSYEHTYFNIKLPEVVRQNNKTAGLVLIAYADYVNDIHPRPQAYLIPSFPSRWRFVGIPFRHQKFLADIQLSQKMHDLTPIYSSIYLLTAKQNMTELYRAAFSFGLIQDGPCNKIRSDRQKILRQEVWLCPVKKI